MTDPLEPETVILACGHRRAEDAPWEPVMLFHVVEMDDGRAVASGSVCERCAARDREGFRTEREAWAAARG